MEIYRAPDGAVIEFELRRSLRSKRLRLAVYPGGRLVVSAPFLLGRRRIEAALSQKAPWIREKIALMKDRQPAPLRRSSRAEYEKNKAAALALVEERLAYFNNFYHFTFGPISIRDQKTRWGSCSRRGALSFNYRLALLPRPLADYVIVHELCHRGRFDHSPRFWQLVEKTIPDYRARRAALKKEGLSLS